jgi:hypothetical protein
MGRTVDPHLSRGRAAAACLAGGLAVVCAGGCVQVLGVTDIVEADGGASGSGSTSLETASSSQGPSTSTSTHTGTTSTTGTGTPSTTGSASGSSTGSMTSSSSTSSSTGPRDAAVNDAPGPDGTVLDSGPDTGTKDASVDSASNCAGDGGSCGVTGSGFPLCAGYQTASGNGGYTFGFSDGCPGSAVCLEQTSFCAAGTNVPAGPSFSCFGNGIGMNVNQPQGGGVRSSLVPTGTGLGYTVTAIPSGGLRIELVAGGVTYCANAAGLSGTIPWSSFNTLCFNSPPNGTAYSPSIAIAEVEFLSVSGSASISWSFCVSSLTL